MVQAGGITRREIKAKQPFLKMDVISSKNEGAKYVPSLGMTDPNLVVVHIPIKDGSPSLAEADYVDIVASIDQINYSAQNSMAPIVSVPQPFESTTGIQYGVTPTYGPPPTATPQPTPTLTPTPAVIPPVAKVIVRGAIVTHVYRDTVGVSSSDGTNQSVVYGDIVGIDVLVPRDSQEVISMAISAGVINASLLSPLADVKSGPTLGMSINDFLDWYYSDRNQLRPQPTAVPEQAQPAAPAPEQPTAVPQPPVNIDSGQPTN